VIGAKKASTAAYSMMKLIAILLLLTPAVLMAAPLGSATGNYGKDLGQIQGIVDSFQGQKIACSEKFPALKDDIARALTNWELRNRAALDELSKKVDDYMNIVAKGNSALVAKQKDATEVSNRRNLANLKSYLASIQLDSAKKMCSRIPAQLNTDMSILEDIMRFQFETVRKRDGAAEKPS
jgi:hypothetical protein